MVGTVKKAVKKAAAPKGAAAISKAAISEFVVVKNVSNKTIQTCKGPIKPGEVGQANQAEARQLGKFLEKI